MELKNSSILLLVRACALFSSLICFVGLEAIETKTVSREHSPSLSRRLFSAPTPPSSPQPRHLRSKSLDSIKVRFSQCAEPKPNPDESEENIELWICREKNFKMHALVRHLEKSIIITPPDIPQDPESITAEFLNTDLGDTIKDPLYNKLMQNKPIIAENNALLYQALIAQSVINKLEEHCEIQARLQRLVITTKKLMPFINDDEYLQTFKQILGALSTTLSGIVASNNFCKNHAERFKNELEETGIEPFRLMLEQNSILPPEDDNDTKK